jgi:predicted aconitase with swiveling domain
VGIVIEGRVLVGGHAEAAALVLDEPLSFWGGLDPATGRIVDVRHPRHGAVVTGRILVMPSGRGSSSSATVLAESIRLGTAPAGVMLREPDEILAIGALVAEELYGKTVPIVAVEDDVYGSIGDGQVLML